MIEFNSIIREIKLHKKKKLSVNQNIHENIYYNSN